MNFGIPYMGSKSAIAKVICQRLPGAENFYDLFGGGFAISHCMLKQHPKKYEHFHFNEIESDTVGLIRRAISGEFNYERFKPDFISREGFGKNKSKCAYTRIIWSFGNNQKSYIFGEDIEPLKKSLHNAVVFNRFDSFAKKVFGKDKFEDRSTITQRRLFSRTATKKRLGELQQLQQLQQLERLERLERLQQLEQLQQLERLQRLEQLQRLQRLQLTSHDYRAVEIKKNSVVYCDPPYSGTASYTRQFDHAAFWAWTEESPHPTFVSEYKAPASFQIMFSIEKKTRLSTKGMTTTKHESVFVNPAGKRLLESIGVPTFANYGSARNAPTKT